MKNFKLLTSFLLTSAVLLSSCGTENEDANINKNEKNNELQYTYEDLQIAPISDDNKSSNQISVYTNTLDTVTSDTVENFSNSFFALDTINTVTLYVENQEKFDKYMKLVQATVNEYERVLSKTIEGSFTYELNKNKTYDLENHPYKSQILYLLGKSIYYNELSKENFDITVEPLVELWGFGTDKQGYVPTDDELRATLEKVDSDFLSINGDIVTLKNDATIDFGGIAKGYIGDKAKELLIEEGVVSGLLNLGGNVITIGLKPDSQLWKIGVQDPNSSRGELLGVVDVNNKSVVTSGIYERNFEVDGTLYHHIISPKTGTPSTTNISAGMIISDTSIDGDALATSIVLLGIEEGLELINSLEDVDCIIIDKDLNKYFSDGFEEKYSYQDIE